VRVLRVTYGIIPLQALSQVATLRGICEGYYQNYWVRSSSTALANGKHPGRLYVTCYRMADIGFSLVMIVADG
jgi:hypothetical protein